MRHEGHMIDVVIKKDFFVKSRKDNIKDEFDFLSVKIIFDFFRFLVKVPMELSTKQRKKSIQI